MAGTAESRASAEEIQSSGVIASLLKSLGIPCKLYGPDVSEKHPKEANPRIAETVEDEALPLVVVARVELGDCAGLAVLDDKDELEDLNEDDEDDEDEEDDKSDDVELVDDALVEGVVVTLWVSEEV